jgi:hypothetical protein
MLLFQLKSNPRIKKKKKRKRNKQKPTHIGEDAVVAALGVEAGEVLQAVVLAAGAGAGDAMSQLVARARGANMRCVDNVGNGNAFSFIASLSLPPDSYISFLLFRFLVYHFV